MNDVTRQFLNSMLTKIEEDVQKDMKALIGTKVVENLNMLTKQGIISLEDGKLFAEEHDLKIGTTIRKRSTPPISSDSCGGGFSRSASC